MQLKAIPTQFVNAEPATLGTKKRKRPKKVVIVSFGGIEGPVQAGAISLKDARQMVIDLVAALAAFGDETAQQIGDQFFFGTPE